MHACVCVCVRACVETASEYGLALAMDTIGLVMVSVFEAYKSELPTCNFVSSKILVS
jgi:hypothetical protein